MVIWLIKIEKQMCALKLQATKLWYGWLMSVQIGVSCRVELTFLELKTKMYTSLARNSVTRSEDKLQSGFSRKPFTVFDTLH
jgi:hypothetical protein